MIQLVLAMTIWGTLGIFALWSGLSAFELTFYRCLIGSVALSGYCWKKQYFNHPGINMNNLFYSFAGGLFIVLNWIFLFKSFQLASITIGNVSYYLQPVFLVMLGILFFRESVKRKQWFYILLTTIGVMLTSNLHLGTLEPDRQLIAGTCFAISAGLLYAFATIFVKFIKDMPPALITLIQMCAGCLILLPMMNLSDITHLNSQAVGNILIIGMVHTALAYLLYYQSLNQVNLTLIAVLSYIDPIVAIITDILFCYRTLDGLQMVGILLTFIGSYQVIRLKKDQQSSSTEPVIKHQAKWN